MTDLSQLDTYLKNYVEVLKELYPDKTDNQRKNASILVKLIAEDRLPISMPLAVIAKIKELIEETYDTSTPEMKFELKELHEFLLKRLP